MAMQFFLYLMTYCRFQYTFSSLITVGKVRVSLKIFFKLLEPKTSVMTAH